MNIDHVSPDVDIPEGVLINHIFDHQLRLMGKYHDIETKNGINYPEPPWHIDDSKVQQILKDMFWRTTEEIAEAIEVVPDLVGKNWKETWDAEVIIRHFFEELADSLHFLTEASIIANIDAALDLEPIRKVIIHDGDGNARTNHDVDGIKKICADVIFNLGLAANTLKNKPWKSTQMPTDANDFKVKLLQTWKANFWMWSELGCSMNDVYRLYFRKMQVNSWRQKTNY